MQHTPVILFGLCIVGAVCWIIVSLKDIALHRGDLERADKQLAMYLALHLKARDGPEKIQTQEQVDISRTIYFNVAHAYNLCLIKPQNKILARIMGYHTIAEKEIKV